MDISFNQLYKSLHKKIYLLVFRYVQQAEDAQEITADVFVQVHQKLPGYRGEAKIETWIYRIAINACLDFLKYQKRKKRKNSFFQSLGISDVTEYKDLQYNSSFVGTNEQQEQAAILHAAVNKLSEKQRNAFILCYEDELPQKEVAAILQVSLKALESLLQRAKAELRKILEKEYDMRRKT